MKIRRQSLFCVSLSNTYGDPVKVLLLSPLRLHILGGGGFKQCECRSPSACVCLSVCRQHRRLNFHSAEGAAAA